MGRSFILILLVAFAVSAKAEISPPRGGYDARVRKVDYNPENVVLLTTFYGVSTHIQFGDGEKIKDIATGDDQAWAIRPRSGNHLFIKPRATNADTNLTVVTDKRTYQFALIVRETDRENSKAWRDPNLIFSLAFNYPDEAAARQAAFEMARQEKEKKNAVQRKMDDAKQAIRNYDYWLAGALEVSPTEAYDDGRFTRLVFSKNRDMPAVYAVDSEGAESLVNSNVEGNTIVIHRVFRKLIMRKGSYVACVVNKSFDFDKGNDNDTGTISGDVKRFVREQE